VGAAARHRQDRYPQVIMPVSGPAGQTRARDWSLARQNARPAGRARR